MLKLVAIHATRLRVLPSVYTGPVSRNFFGAASTDVKVEPFTEEHDAIRKTVRTIIDNDINPYVDEWEAKKMFPAHQVFPKLGKAGLLGISKPVEYGGSGLDFSYSVAFIEELANIDCAGIPMAIGVQTDMATPALASFGSEELCRNFLTPAINGEYVACVGVSEQGGGSDVAALRTTAKKSGGDYVINGSKMWITNSVQADWMCLLANTGTEGFPHRNKSLIVVPMKTKGVKVLRNINKMGNHSSDTGEIFFDDVRVPTSHLIGEEGLGFIYQMMQFDQERMFASAITPPQLDKIIQMTIEYCKHRKTFGQPLIDNQYIHFRLAELQIEVECLRALTYRCLNMILAGESCTKLVSMAKIKAGRLVREVTDTCLQFWGGMGYSDDTLISRAYRDARLLSIGGGADEIMLGLVCKLMGILPKARKHSK